MLLVEATGEYVAIGECSHLKVDSSPVCGREAGREGPAEVVVMPNINCWTFRIFTDGVLKAVELVPAADCRYCRSLISIASRQPSTPEILRLYYMIVDRDDPGQCHLTLSSVSAVVASKFTQNPLLYAI
jgi:hypothetical protein